ncbi:MAG: hypothetical protein IJQ25_00235 [Oscillibacter sp.]|nr:hypothetical protein [Oscillibacter sp.]
MRHYVGVTIGPIFDTISNATIPAALWFASYLFSDLSRRICEGVAAIPGAEIVSPYHDGAAENDGVGKYHDRVIFYTDAFGDKSALDGEVKRVVDTVIKHTGDAFPDEALKASSDAAKPYTRAEFQAFLEQYLQIHYVILSEKEVGEENCILALSPYLDALELMKAFPMNSKIDPFRRMFARKDVLEDSGNALIKQSVLFPPNDKNFLTVGRRIRSIPEIARAAKDSDWKRDHYYAVVSADGDGMGNFLLGLKNDWVGFFSKGCLAYDKKAAELVSNYGGMPIYAGGDDLLFLAPLTGRRKTSPKGESIVSLCAALRDLFARTIRTEFEAAFREKFPDEAPPELSYPTMSFGVAVQFEKFPLYEALERARKLLEMSKTGEKDNILLELRKHSGQGTALLIHNPDAEAFEELSGAARGDAVGGEKPTALLYTLENFHAVVSVMIANTRARLDAGEAPDTLKEEFVSTWGNLFDNPGQKVSDEYTKAVGGAYFTRLLSENRRVTVPDYAVPGEFQDNSLRSLVNILIWEKFMREKAGDET